jgi:hypothetical protein
LQECTLQQQSIKMTLFKADIGYVPRMPLDTIAARSEGHRRPTGRPMGTSIGSSKNAGSFATLMSDILIEFKRNLSHAQELQVAEANKHRRPHTFQEGDKVFTSTKNLPLTYRNSAENGHRKTLQHKYMGPFELEKRRGAKAFEIAVMPGHWKLSRKFNVDRLRDASNFNHTREQDPPTPLRLKTRVGNERAAYEMDEIRSWRRKPNKDGRIECETKWMGYTELT